MNSETNEIQSNYGESIVFYRGTGKLTDIGDQSYQCEFQIWQLVDGTVVLQCEFLEQPPISEEFKFNLKHFEGKTDTGIKLFSDKGGFQINDLGENLPEAGTIVRLAFFLKELVVDLPNSNNEIKYAEFGITNFLFTGQNKENFLPTSKPTEWVKVHNLTELPLELRGLDKRVTDLVIIRNDSYENIKRRLKVLKNVAVTCKIKAELDSEEEMENLREIIDDLCHLLSIARGTKVQWIYIYLYNGENKNIKRFHYANRTKPFNPLALIAPENPSTTKRFIESTFETFQMNKSGILEKSLINTYLEAKSENDFIEARGLKLAITLETLKYAFTSMKDSPANEYIIDEKKFKEIVPEMRTIFMEFMKSKDLPKESESFSEEKFFQFNRRSFRYVLKKLLKDIDLDVSSKDLALFIASRNKLVHTGNFYYKVATPRKRQKRSPHNSKAEEYFFLVNFLDKIFLKLLNYSGEYKDISSIPKGETAKIAIIE